VKPHAPARVGPTHRACGFLKKHRF